MKKLLLTILVLAILGNLCVIYAQPWMALLPKDKKQSELTFYDYQKAFNNYWEPFNLDNGYMIIDGQKVKAPGWKQFKRWEHEMYYLINLETGELPKENAFYLTELNRQKNPHVYPKSTHANWISLGPSRSQGNYALLGRINCVAFHPTDINTYWIGAASGGLWKTTDNGNTWKCLTDNNPVLGISDIIIPTDYQTSNTIYIATGDKNALDNQSIGVLKSTDGGLSWNHTGMSGQYSTLKTYRLLIDPNNSNILIVANQIGVYKTIDGGTNWSQVLIYKEFVDMEYKPGDFNTLYGSTKNGSIYVSTNGGSTWTEAINTEQGFRTELAVTPANPSIVYAVVSNNSSCLLGIYKSTNSGNTFTQVFSGNNKNLLGRSYDGYDNAGQAWYDLCIEVSPTNANIVFVGGIHTWRSTNGGFSWEIVSNLAENAANNVHVDKHTLRYRNNGDLFEGNDGGIYISSDNGVTWIDKTNGMEISQFYKIGVSATDPSVIIGGTQDNGTKSLANGEWVNVYGGDGMGCIIDYTNQNIQYASSQGGNIVRTDDFWNMYSFIRPIGAGIGAWVTPFLLDPIIPSTIYAGYSDVWKSTNRGSSWTKISDINSSSSLESMAIAPSNNQVIFIATYTDLWKTSNGGTTWVDLSNYLPTVFSSISSITVNSFNPDIVWLTVGSYGGRLIYQSNDGGYTWSNISQGLPSIPAYCVVQNKLIENEIHLYLATEVGVYFKKGNYDWVFYNNGLPNVKVRDLEIYYGNSIANSRLRAGTYGRGIWETPLNFTPEQMIFESCTSTQNNTNNVYTNSINQEILGVKIVTREELSPLNISSFTFNTNSSTKPSEDIVNAKLFYSGSNNSFSTSTQFGNTVANPDGIFIITGNQTLLSGNNYFWLTYDISENAKIENFVDAECLSLIIDEQRTPTISSPAGNRKIVFEYCTASASSAYEYISNVIVGTINNISYKAQPGYENFSNLVTEVEIGIPINFSITVEGSYPSDKIMIWADLNNNGSFDDNEQLFSSSGSDFVSPLNESFIIPESTSPGLKRLRIRLQDTGGTATTNYTPCGTSSWGEVEDYTINAIINNIGITSSQENNIQIFPNPTKNKIQIINNKYIINDVSLFDFSGKELIKMNEINNNEIQINLETFTNGIYLLKIKTEQGYFNTKILKVD